MTSMVVRGTWHEAAVSAMSVFSQALIVFKSASLQNKGVAGSQAAQILLVDQYGEGGAATSTQYPS
jgi:hypothetical protein